MKATVLNNGRLYITLLQDEVRISAGPCPRCGEARAPAESVALYLPQEQVDAPLRSPAPGLFARIGDMPIGRFLTLVNVVLWGGIIALVLFGSRLFR